MPEQLPQDGCTPVYAPDHPLKCRRYHLCIPLAGVDEPGHPCRQSEPQFQRLEQSAPGAKKKQPVYSNYSNRTKPIPQRYVANQTQYILAFLKYPQ